EAIRAKACWTEPLTTSVGFEFQQATTLGQSAYSRMRAKFCGSWVISLWTSTRISMPKPAASSPTSCKARPIWRSAWSDLAQRLVEVTAGGNAIGSNLDAGRADVVRQTNVLLGPFDVLAHDGWVNRM